MLSMYYIIAAPNEVGSRRSTQSCIQTIIASTSSGGRVDQRSILSKLRRTLVVPIRGMCQQTRQEAVCVKGRVRIPWLVHFFDFFLE